MTEQLVYLVLIVLIVVSALNLKLTLGLLKAMNNPPVNVEQSSPVPLGEMIPNVMAKELLTNEAARVAEKDKPAALLFLSSKCPTCKEKLPQIESIYPMVEQAGLSMRLISTESKSRMNHFLHKSPLQHDVLLLRKKAYKKLNPALASPFYLFIDHESKLQAYGTIGDDDWQSFIEQMNDMDVTKEAV